MTEARMQPHVLTYKTAMPQTIEQVPRKTSTIAKLFINKPKKKRKEEEKKNV